MIITCEECTTRFKLDDARIPAKGAKVRCSKCKYAFFVKPESSAGDPVESAVSQAIADDEVDSQGASASGQERLDSNDPAGDSSEPLRTPDDQSAQSAMDDFEESDWEFNTEEPANGEEELESFQSPPGLELGEGETQDIDLDAEGPIAAEPEDPSSLDLAGDSVHLDETGEATQPETLSGVDAASEAVDDLLGGVDDDDDDEELFDTSPGAVERGIDALLDDGPEDEVAVAPEPEPAAAPEPSPAPTMDTALDDLGLDDEPEPAPPPAAVPLPRLEEPAPAPAPEREELGDPGEWDIFGEEAESPRDPAPAPTQPLVIGRVGENAAESRPPVQVAPELPANSIWLGRAVHGAGWTAVAALSALILFQSLWLAPRTAPEAATSQQVAGLEVSALEGRWVENTSGAWLYVISGEAAGAGQAAAPGSRLSVRLLDATGAPLVDEAADFGPALPTWVLREQDPEALRAGQTGSAGTLAWQTFRPAQQVRVAAVIEEMPTAARRFELTAVPVSRPASPAPRVEQGGPVSPAAGDGSAPAEGGSREAPGAPAA